MVFLSKISRLAMRVINESFCTSLLETLVSGCSCIAEMQQLVKGRLLFGSRLRDLF